MKRKILYLLFLILPFYVFCNDGYYVYGSGGTLIPEVNKNISMEKELIEIDVFPLGGISKVIADYKCTFWFKNNTDKKQSVLIGFPIQKGRHESSSPGYEHEGNIDSYDFKVTVDDKPLAYKVYEESQKSEVPGLPFLNSQIYAFTVEFNPGETKQIINTYREQHETEGRGSNITSFTYILQSGNTRGKPIGQADIIIQYHAPMPKINFYENHPNPYLKNISYSQKDPYTTITFHAENFKPETNIYFISNFFDLGPFYKTTELFGKSIMQEDEGKNGFYGDVWGDIERNSIEEYGVEYSDNFDLKNAMKDLSAESIKALRNSLLVAYGYGGRTEDEKKYFYETFYSDKAKCRYYNSYYGESVRPIFYEEFDFNKELPCLKRIYENFNSAKNWQADLTQDCTWMMNKIKNEDSWYYAALVYDQIIDERKEFPVSDKSVLRKLLYECGNFYYDKGYFELASNLYWEALEYTDSYESAAVETYHNDRYDTNFTRYTWKDEGKNNAPCYYIMYNILCCTCLKQTNLPKTQNDTRDFLLTRLELVLHMGYPNYSWLRKDSDIELIRRLYPREFEALIQKYENKK